MFQSMDRDWFLASIIPLLTVLTIELATKTMSFQYFFFKSNLTDQPTVSSVVLVLECWFCVYPIQDFRLHQSDNFQSSTREDDGINEQG